MAGMYEGMPLLVDAGHIPPLPRNVPPPNGATYFPDSQSYTDAADNIRPLSSSRSAYQDPSFNIPGAFPSNAFPGHNRQGSSHYAQSYNDSPWPQYDYTQPSIPSPYVPPQSTYDDPGTVAPLRRTHSHSGPPAGYGLTNSRYSHSPHPSSPWDRPSPHAASVSSRHNMRPTAYPANNSDYSPSSTISRSNSVSGYAAPRFSGEPPRDWRRDFRFRSGFTSFFRIKRTTSKHLNDFVDSSRSTLHHHLRYDGGYISYDLRRHPSTVAFRDVQRPLTPWDLQQYACEPPAVVMRLYSSRLPWYIDIRASNPIGATIGDVFTGLYTSLNTPIQKDDYYNEELDDADRYKLREAWEERCHDASERSCGVRRVDFLRGKIGFEGLVRGKDGMWEVKTRRQ